MTHHHQHDGGLDYHRLVQEAVNAHEATFSPGALRGIKYAILAVAQAIRDSKARESSAPGWSKVPQIEGGPSIGDSLRWNGNYWELTVAA